METVAFHLSSIPIATKGEKMEEIVGRGAILSQWHYLPILMYYYCYYTHQQQMVQRQLHLAVEWMHIISIYVFTAGLGVLECKIQSIFHQPHKQRGNEERNREQTIILKI